MEWKDSGFVHLFIANFLFSFKHRMLYMMLKRKLEITRYKHVIVFVVLPKIAYVNGTTKSKFDLHQEIVKYSVCIQLYRVF